ncbi:MAG: DUF4136 domain-containing protein [Gammaproteobacteria bacterium]|nr:DUF4136 domain-containing protein [Gammaproteobacteria bacterium]
MSNKNILICKLATVVMISVSAVSCVTEVSESPSAMKFSDTAVISVRDPGVYIAPGSTIAWLPEAVRYYQDERLKDAPLKSLIEKEIVANLQAKKMSVVESVNGANYAIAYTAALESSLDDTAIIRRFGLLPGNAQIPQNDANVEKGSLIVYVFNSKTSDIVWRSAAQVGVKFDTTADEQKLRVKRVVKEIFQTFPVAEKT